MVMGRGNENSTKILNTNNYWIKYIRSRLVITRGHFLL